MKRVTILFVEDDDDIREMTATALEQADFTVIAVSSAEKGLKRVKLHIPDIFIIDWMLPGISGVEMTKRLRNEDATSEIPIILLTARNDEDDIVSALNSGVDDYITKPFSPRELIARIKALLRRSGNSPKIKIGKLCLDSESHRLLIEDKEVKIGPTEYRLLEFLLNHPEKVYSREQLLDRVWGRGIYVEERTVDVHILRLRKLLAPYGLQKMIQTVRSAGYRLSKDF